MSLDRVDIAEPIADSHELDSRAVAGEELIQRVQTNHSINFCNDDEEVEELKTRQEHESVLFIDDTKPVNQDTEVVALTVQ